MLIFENILRLTAVGGGGHLYETVELNDILYLTQFLKHNEPFSGLVDKFTLKIQI
jgi:hypothetical protein